MVDGSEQDVSRRMRTYEAKEPWCLKNRVKRIDFTLLTPTLTPTTSQENDPYVAPSC